MEKNAAYRANIPTSFYIHLNYDAQKYKHPDLSRSRIKKDLDAINSILGMLETRFIDPLSPLPLMCISASVVANKKGDERYVTCRNFRRSCDENISRYSIMRTESKFFRSN